VCVRPESVPGSNELRTFSPEIQQLWVQHQSLRVRGEILYRKFVRPDGSLLIGRWLCPEV